MTRKKLFWANFAWKCQILSHKNAIKALQLRYIRLGVWKPCKFEEFWLGNLVFFTLFAKKRTFFSQNLRFWSIFWSYFRFLLIFWRKIGQFFKLFAKKPWKPWKFWKKIHFRFSFFKKKGLFFKLFAKIPWKLEKFKLEALKISKKNQLPLPFFEKLAKKGQILQTFC